MRALLCDRSNLKIHAARRCEWVPKNKVGDVRCKAHEQGSQPALKQAAQLKSTLNPIASLCTTSAALYLLTAGAALADDVAGYNPATGEDFLKNAAGVGYILLVGIFLYRVLTRRAKRAREERIAGKSATSDLQQTPVFNELRSKLGANAEQREANALDAFLGAAQAGLLGFGLFIFTSKMSTIIGAQDLPAGYTARNISITVRTILLGLGWLATFIFSANSVGLLGLSVQMLLFPDSLREDADDAFKQSTGPQLPKISVTSKPDEVRRAFETVQKQGLKEGAQQAQAPSMPEEK